MRGWSWPVGVLLIALALVYGPFVATGGLLAVGDGLGYYFPVRALAALSLRLGELPFWNPVNFGGIPLHGMLQAGVFFPGNWGFLCLPPVAAMNLAVLGASFVAGVSMYALARALELDRLPALAAALPFMLAGYLEAHLEQVTSVQVVSLIPAVLWAIERFHRSGDRRYALGLGAILALQLLAGYPQTSLITLVIAAAYAWHRGGDRAYYGWLALCGGLALLAAAVELVPVLDVIAQSQRLALTYDEIVWHSVTPRHLTTLLFPYMYGGPVGELFKVPYWGVGPYYIEVTGYAGLAPVILALVALRERRARFWLALALVGLVLALGDTTPIYKLWAQIPVIRSIRVPGRHLLEWDLGLCVLGALGLQRLIDAEPARRRRLALGACAAVGAAMGLVWAVLGLGHDAVAARLAPWLPKWLDVGQAIALSQPAFWVPGLLLVASTACLVWFRPALLLGVLFVDLALFSRGQDWNVFGARPGPLALTAPTAPYRTLPVTLGVPLHHYALAHAVHAPMLCVFDGERSAGGYEAFVPKRYGELLGGMDNMSLLLAGGPWGADAHVLDLLGVKTVYLDARAAGTGFDPGLRAPRWLRQPDRPFVQVYENPRALPRGWRVAEARVLAPAEVDRRIKADPAFDPARTALLEAGPAPAGLAPGPVTVTPRSPNRLAVETAGGAGLVLVNESYDAGWHAYQGAHELPVRRADGLVLGVEVPAGAQAFELRYTPPRWAASLLASLAGLLGLLLAALYARASGWAKPTTLPPGSRTQISREP